MVARIHTVAFEGVDVLDITVEVQMTAGLPAFTIVGLPDKAVGESRERVRGALHALGLSLPAKRLTVNLAPADVQKEGSHFDLPIALGVLAAMEILQAEELDGYVALGEVSLDGGIRRVAGVLPAAINAAAAGRGLICPETCGAEAAWAGDLDILAPASLLQLLNHFKGAQVLSPPRLDPAAVIEAAGMPAPDLADIKGQETAKRALEIAAAGGHNMLMLGPPGSGKSMLAARLPGLLPPLTPREALDVSMIHSIAGMLDGERLVSARPFRDPHHSSSQPAMIGGGSRAKPGEITLAHHGVLFLDELPEFPRGVLEALRQPMETGKALVSRVNYHVSFPARFQLIAAMNPCKCGYLDDPALACNKAPRCAGDYQSKISGPIFDRIDIHVDVPAVSLQDLGAPATGETTAVVAARVAHARAIQKERLASLTAPETMTCNAHLDGDLLTTAAPMAPDAQSLLLQAAERMKLSARGYHRMIRVARTIADLAAADVITKVHMAEALSFRRVHPALQAVA